MSKSLYQIRKDILVIEQKFVESNGEITPELENDLMINESNLANKVDRYYYFIESLEKGAEFFKARAEEATKARKQYESAIDRLKDNLTLAMHDLKTDELTGEEFRFKLSKSKPAVEILDEEKLPASYMREKVTYTPDKDLIKQDLDKGLIVPGARLVEKSSIRPYVNKKGLK
jgi:Siphovirus Gp157.